MSRRRRRRFEEWLAPYDGQITILKGWEPSKVLVDDGRVVGVEFGRTRQTGPTSLTVKAKLTADSTDWGDIIRLSGAAYMAGPDLKSRFNEPSAPESLDPGGDLEMNPISWCPLLREAGKDSTIPKPATMTSQFADWQGNLRRGWSGTAAAAFITWRAGAFTAASAHDRPLSHTTASRRAPKPSS